MTSVRPGDVIAGKYRVERVLGQGGMGVVVAARHQELDQLVALKFLVQAALDNEEARARFLREARAAVKLKNDHVARVLDVDSLDSGEPFIVLEYLEGQDLAALAKARGPLPAGEAAEYVLQACEALAEAHGLGIVHRDIKLANLFLTRGPAGEPLVKVLDFGVSKASPFGEPVAGITRSSSMLGSPRFMAPEQMRDAREADARADIWSLGVVLYRLVSGRLPFNAEGIGRLLTMVMYETEAPLASLCPDLPSGFSEVVGRCLRKEPADRFTNVAELAFALSDYCADLRAARATADRLAATLLLPPLTTGTPAVSPEPQDPTTPAPWTETRAEQLVQPAFHASRGGRLALGVVLGVFVAGAALVFTRVRRPAPVAPATATTTTTSTTTATAQPNAKSLPSGPPAPIVVRTAVVPANSADAGPRPLLSSSVAAHRPPAHPAASVAPSPTKRQPPPPDDNGGIPASRD